MIINFSAAFKTKLVWLGGFFYLVKKAKVNEDYYGVCFNYGFFDFFRLVGR